MEKQNVYLGWVYLRTRGTMFAYRIWVNKSIRGSQLGRPRKSWEGSIKRHLWKNELWIGGWNWLISLLFDTRIYSSFKSFSSTVINLWPPALTFKYYVSPTVHLCVGMIFKINRPFLGQWNEEPIRWFLVLFITLMICSTYFGHLYAHRQELTIIYHSSPHGTSTSWVLMVVRCGLAGYMARLAATAQHISVIKSTE
jgi:hypothetical protein